MYRLGFSIEMDLSHKGNKPDKYYGEYFHRVWGLFVLIFPLFLVQGVKSIFSHKSNVWGSYQHNISLSLLETPGIYRICGRTNLGLVAEFWHINMWLFSDLRLYIQQTEVLLLS